MRYKFTLMLALFVAGATLAQAQAQQAEQFTTRGIKQPNRPAPGPMNMRGVFTPKYFAPEGTSYEASVPDTLDLARRGALAVEGLINFLDPGQNYEQYQIAFFNVNPPYMAHYNMEASNQGKLAKGIITTRLMSGSTEKLGEQAAMFNAMIDRVNDKGLFYNDLNQGPWVPSITTEDQLCVNTATVLEAMIDLYQVKPNPRLLELIRFMADGMVKLARIEGDCAYYSKVEPEKGDSFIGVLGYWQQMFYHGKSLRVVCRAYMLTHDKKYLELATKLKNLVMLEKHWPVEAAPKAIATREHAWFSGHHHSYLSALMGILLYSEATGDPALMEFVRDGYEYFRNYGLARIGMFGEMCTTGDMTWLGVKLTEMGIGDYWEDVDQYTRNMLVEQQMTDAGRLQKAVDQMPPLTRENIYEYRYAKDGMTTDSVIRRNIGAWQSDASNPTLVRPQTFRWTICCSGNCPPAMYAAWKGIVRCEGGRAAVNLLLNRASPWLDVESYLPYEGKVVIRNKTAKQIDVRMPRWVDLGAVEASLGKASGRRAAKITPVRVIGRYLSFEGLKPGDVLTLAFPVKETIEKHTVLWKVEDMWPESTDPGSQWKPPAPSNVYTMTFRGNTLVDIAPRVQGKGYPLFLREEMKATKAPMTTVKRTIAPKLASW